MKKISLGIMALIFSSFSVAESEKLNNSGFDGFISGAIGHGSNSGDNSFLSNSEKKSGFSGELRGTFSYDHSSGIGVQLDNQYTLQKISGTNLGTNDLAIHGYFRNQDYLIGLFAQRRTFDISQNSYSIHVPLARNFYGFEGQSYLNRITLYTQLGAQNSSDLYYGADSNQTGFIGALEARYFPQDNVKLSLGYQYGTQKNNFYSSNIGGKNEASVYSAGVEYHVENTPLSVFANVQHSNAQSNYFDYKTEVKNTRGLVGVKIYFGDGSLFKRDKSGSTLNPIKLDNSLLAIPNAG